MIVEILIFPFSFWTLLTLELVWFFEYPYLDLKGQIVRAYVSRLIYLDLFPREDGGLEPPRDPQGSL